MTEAVSATLRRIPVHQAVPRDVTSGALVAAASVLSVAVGVMAADRGKLSLAVLGVVCFAVVVALAAKAPGAAFSACIALLVLIPVYAAPTVHALPLYPPLILMWALVIAVAACRAQSAGRVTALDVAVVAMFVMMAASTLVTHAPLREIVFPAFVWLAAGTSPSPSPPGADPPSAPNASTVTRHTFAGTVKLPDAPMNENCWVAGSAPACTTPVTAYSPPTSRPAVATPATRMPRPRIARLRPAGAKSGEP